MDDKTREKSCKNQIIILALAWYFANDGIGSKDIVVLSYKDKLSTFQKYLAYYEYIGKKYDRNRNVINKGITVYGNKDYTDQYSFVQQLLDGLKTFSSL
jgi:glucose-6-phosphate isomerase